MTRFSGLLRNELMKITVRWPNRVLLAVLALVVVVINGVQWASLQSASGGDPEAESAETLKTEIITLQEEQPEDYEEQLEILQFLLTNNINVNVNNWRLMAVQRMAGDIHARNSLLKTGRKADAEQAEALTRSIEQDRVLITNQDYRGYYQKKLADTRASTSLPEKRREQLFWQYQYVLDHKVAAEGSEWKYNLMQGMVSAMSELESQQARMAQGGGVNRRYEKELQATIAIARYRIENEKQVVAGDASTGFYYEEPSRYWQAMTTSVETIVLVSLVVIILAGGIVSGEFASGTIKTLLGVPAKRWKLLAAKYFAVLLCAGALLAGFYGANAVVSGCFFGLQDVGASYIYAEGETVREVSGFLLVGWRYLLASVQILSYGTAAFCMSALFRSTAFAVGINAFFLFAGPYVVSWLKYSMNQDWARYLLFANLDLNAIQKGLDVFPGQTMPFALLVLAVHLGLFLLTAWDAFVYRDVK